eukprot:GHVN01018365.1.p1 GENE.GHVN01018365.1~~GHVN01018365.1.p1  ORF type:complete len:130 (+),score=38.73 GHVN01018365.1:130-519(+)
MINVWCIEHINQPAKAEQGLVLVSRLRNEQRRRDAQHHLLTQLASTKSTNTSPPTTNLTRHTPPSISTAYRKNVGRVRRQVPATFIGSSPSIDQSRRDRAAVATAPSSTSLTSLTSLNDDQVKPDNGSA